jgi:D-alanyl-D-alanine carboxypeptidase
VLVDEGVGIADLEFDVSADRETSFRIGSVTKQFTAAAVMKLFERGALSLDDDISQYLPDFNTGGRAITIRQLLNHASGVPSYTSQPEFFPRGSALNLTDDELLAYIDGVPFDFEPGEGWNYSNTGYYLLGMIIETVSGKSYGEFLADEFFEPLGLSRTRYGSEREIVTNRAQGYDFDSASGKYFNDALISMTTPGAAGALISTAGDLVRWQIALTGGRAVRPESYQEMITSTVPTGQGQQQYGFGLMINVANGQKSITHTGGIPGFNSILTTMPEADLNVAVISNSNGLPSAAVAGNIIAALTSAEAPPLPEQRLTALPGGEAAVRRLLDELARGEPDYELMSPQLAEATRAQLPAMQPMVQSLGAIRTISFRSVGPAGQDIFDVQLENGSLTFMIVLDADGRTVLGAGMRPGAPPAQ